MFVGLVALSILLVASGAEWVKIDGREAHPTHVLAKFKAGGNVARLGAVAQDIKVDRTYSHIPGLAVLEARDVAKVKASVAIDTDPAAVLKKTIENLKGTGLFEYVEPDYVLYANLTPSDRAFLDGRLWGLNNTGQQGGVSGADINVVPAWDLTTGDTNMVVAVIDTGVNYNHQDLAAQMWRNPDEIPGNGIDDDGNGFIDDVYGINAINDSGDPLDDNGHGSHCAGTIGAAANNGHDHVGVIWNVRIMALKFLGASGGGLNSDMIQCVNYALSKNVKLSSNSYGGYGYDQAQYDAIDAARRQGHLFITAAGNETTDTDQTPHYPSAHNLDNIVAVAALDRSDQLAGFSNWGATTVDIGAPGVDIFSCWMGPTNAYNTISGTSMACPHVAGVAALSWSTDLTATYSEIRDRILQSAVPIPALAGKCVTGGRVNAFGAMGGNVDGILELSVSPPSGSYFATGSQADVFVKVRDAFNVNDATVTGRFNGVNYTLLNNGIAPDLRTNDGVYSATLTVPTVPGTYTFSVDVKAPGKVDGHIDVSYLILTPPSNDHFLQATKIPAGGGSREGDNRLATPEPGTVPGDPNYGPDIGEPLHAGISNTRSLWWSWSTPVSTPVIVDSAGTSFDDDAVLGVYTGSQVSALAEVGSSQASTNGPNGTRAPFVKFVAQPNLTYWIAVAQSQLGTNSPGRVALRVEPNGELDTTKPLVRVTNYISGSFIRSRTNTITISGVAEDPPPNISGVSAVQVKVLGDLLWTDAAGTSNWVSKPIQLTNGVNTIFIRAFDRADNESQTVQLTLTYIPQELSNDLFGNAETLTGTSGSAVATNSTASKEFGEPAHGGNEGGHSMWWTFTPPSDGILVLSTDGSSFDTLMGLYYVNDPVTERSVSSVQDKVVAQNDDAEGTTTGASEIVHAVQQGRLYYIAVDGYAGQTGKIQLNYNFSSLDVFPLTVTSGPGGSVLPASGDFPANSGVTLRGVPDKYMQVKEFRITTSGGTLVVTNNPYTFLLTEPTTVFAEFTAKQFTDDFSSGALDRLSYQNTGNHWTVASTNGSGNATSLVARVVQNLPDSTTASLVLVTNLLAGSGSFEFRVNTETNYDRFEFLLDGRVVGAWSGQIPWRTFQFEVPPKAGATRLEWRFTKDLALSEPDEFVGIDNLDLALAPPVTPGPINVTIARTETDITITATGPANADFQLYSSLNLETWNAVEAQTFNSGTSGTVNFHLPIPSGPPRFFIVKRL